MFACGSKKKKNQMEALDPETVCKIHKANFEFICIKSDTEIPLQIKGCNLCKQEKKNDIFIPIKEISQRLIMQQYQDLIEKLCHSIKPFIDQIENLKIKLEEQINYFKQQLSRHIEDMVVTLLFKESHPKPFNTQDMYLLMSKLAISNMSSIIEQQPILKTDEHATYITTKLIYNEKESQKIAEILQDDYKFVTNRINDISQDLDNLFNTTYKQLQQIKSKNTKVVQMDEKDKALSFIIDVKKYSQGQHGQLLQQIQNIKQNKKIKKDKYESPDQVQVKCIVKLTDDQLAFSSNLPKIQFIKNEEIIHTLSLQDCEVTVLQKVFEDPHLLVGLEKNETEYTIDLYEIKTYTNLKTFIAHTGYIWNIINLPDYHIASCSDDSTIKIFNLQQWKEVQQLQVHQSAINDLALFNNDILVSVADDGMTVFQDFKKSELLGLHNEEAEVKCVSSLDGVSIVTGNSKGEIKIFGYTDQINLIKQIQLHKGLIRYICRVSPKIFVTSSWDGKHIFYSLQDDKIKEIEGPQVNMSEAMLWDQQKNCLISGQKGQLIIYQ